MAEEQKFDPTKPFKLADEQPPDFKVEVIGAHPEAKIGGARPGGSMWGPEIAYPADHVSERDRADNSFAGLPPELAAISAMKIGQAIGAGGLSIVGRAFAGLKAAGGEAMPVLKYDVAKRILEGVGVPPWLAMAGAGILSGFKKGPAAAAGELKAADAAVSEDIATKAINEAKAAQPAQATGTSMVPAAVPASQPPSAAAPAAQPPPTAAPPAAAQATTAAPAAAPAAAAPFYPQKALNELAILAKRGNVPQLTGAEYQQGLDLVRQGASPQKALELIVAKRSGQAPSFGVGLPSDAEVAAAVKERNATGRWPK